jgi:tetratricopeptide (TPR) repeat protein
MYEQSPGGRRARLHRGVGEALDAAHGSRADEIAPQLAAHFQRGHDPARALRYLTAAGLRARRRFASREAIAYLESALAWVALLPDAGERRRREAEVRMALGRALGDVHGFGAEPVRENYERVSQLCAEPDGAAYAFEALYARWYLHALRAERDETIARAAELVDLARRLNTAGHGVLADSVLVRTAFYDGRFTDARRHMESLRARRPEQQEVDAPVGYGVDPVIAATIHCAAALWFLGDPESARTTAHAGLARARDSGNPFFLSAALMQTALVDLLCRNGAGGDLATQAQTLSAAQGFALWHGLASALKGWAVVQQGQAAQGIREIERALAALRATDTRFFLAYMYAFLAEGRLRAGAPTEGLAAADAGLAVTATTLDRGYEPELWRLKGELLLASSSRFRPQRGRRTAKPVAAADSDWPEAERCLLRALELSRAAEAKSLELRTATSLARAWRTRGRTAEARAVLTEVSDWFAASLDTPDLVEARALLGELSTAT